LLSGAQADVKHVLCYPTAVVADTAAAAAAAAGGDFRQRHTSM